MSASTIADGYPEAAGEPRPRVTADPRQDAFWFEASADWLAAAMADGAPTAEPVIAPQPNGSAGPAIAPEPGATAEPRKVGERRATTAPVVEPESPPEFHLHRRPLHSSPVSHEPRRRTRTHGSVPAVIVPDPPEFLVSRLQPRTWFERRAEAIARETELAASGAADRLAAEPPPAPHTSAPAPETSAPAPETPAPAPVAPEEAPEPAAARWRPPEPHAQEREAQPAVPMTATVAVSKPARSWGWTGEWGFDTSEHGAVRARRERRARDGGRPRTRRLWAPVGLLAAGACVVVGVVGLSTTTATKTSLSRQATVAASTRQTDALGIVAVPAPSPYAMQTIPLSYLRIYIKVGEEYGLDWTMLAAVGQIESRSGTSQLQGVQRGTNAAGAAGPAQFEAATWQRFGVNADGRGQISPYDPLDAITSMAAYLKASGAPQNWNQALLTYNHSQEYANSVTALARRFNATGAAP